MPEHVSVKEAVLPFSRFTGADTVLGPGDEEHRRGDGRRRRLPDRVRQGAVGGGREAARAPARSSSRSPTTTRRRRRSSRPASATSASRSSPPAEPRRRSQRMGVPVTRINKIHEGSPNVVDYIERRGRSRDQHPDRLRRPRRRLRDPQRRNPPRDPLHHDDDRRLSGGPGDRRRAATGRGAKPAGAARRCARGAAERPAAATAPAADEARVAPSAAAAARSPPTRHRRLPDLLAASTARGPLPAAGQFYMLAAERGWAARAGGRSCRGRSRSPRRPGDERRPALVPARGRRPRHPPPRRLRAGRGRLLTGPLGNGFPAPREALPRRRRGDPGRRRHRPRSAGDLRRGLAARGVPRDPARLPRPRALRRPRAVLARAPLLGGAARERGRPRRPPRLRDRPARGDARRRRRRLRRRLRLRPAGDAGGRPRALRGARRRRRAGDGIADGVRIRRLLRLRGAAARRRLHAPLRRRPGRSPDEERRGGGGGDDRRSLRDPARPPDHQRLGNLRRDRRPAGVRRRPARALSLQRLRLEDDHSRSRAPATRRGGSGRSRRRWSTRSGCPTRASTASSPRTCRSSPSCRCR